MKTLFGHLRSRRSRRGHLLLVVGGSMSMIAMLSLCMLSLQMSGSKEQHAAQQTIRAELAADAALSQSLVEVQNGRSGVLGSAQAPVTLAGEKVYVTSTSFGASGTLLKLLATAIRGKNKTSAELVLQNNVDPHNMWAAFGLDYVYMSSQAKIDSYDSSLGTYASQDTHGSGSGAWANANGNIGSNGDITLRQNSLVFGNAAAGPGDSTTIVGNAAVSGSTAPQLTDLQWPSVSLPVNPAVGATPFTTNTAVSSGTHAYGTTALSTGVTVTVSGPATLVFDSLTMRSGSSIIVNQANGPVDIYVVNNVVMSSNTTIRSVDYSPASVRLHLLSDNIFDPNVQVQLDQVEFDSNSTLYGTIYAPTAAVVIDSNFEVFGGIVAQRVDLRSNSRIHFDEALARALNAGQAHFTRISWRVIR